MREVRSGNQPVSAGKGILVLELGGGREGGEEQEEAKIEDQKIDQVRWSRIKSNRYPVDWICLALVSLPPAPSMTLSLIFTPFRHNYFFFFFFSHPRYACCPVSKRLNQSLALQPSRCHRPPRGPCQCLPPPIHLTPQTDPVGLGFRLVPGRIPFFPFPPPMRCLTTTCPTPLHCFHFGPALAHRERSHSHSSAPGAILPHRRHQGAPRGRVNTLGGGRGGRVLRDGAGVPVR